MLEIHVLPVNHEEYALLCLCTEGCVFLRHHVVYCTMFDMYVILEHSTYNKFINDNTIYF